ncbi:MAG: hypothetical protein M3081_02830 [Gemmatimonadota bacterium]|nr:hypothetical protein [Gemmatimonadota bacterium]
MTTLIRVARRAVIALGLGTALASRTGAQAAPPTASPPSSITVFLDCSFMCDADYLHTEITYVNWVTDRAAADVHLLITSENTGGGGTQFTLAFLGRRVFAGVGDTLQFANSATATSDETRIALTRVIKIGLVRFIARTTLAGRLQISLAEGPPAERSDAQSHHDPWNFWVFTTSFNANANGDANNRFTSVNGGLTARRTTETWKINLSVNENYNQSTFTLEDHKSTFIRRSYNLSQLAVRSLGPRWSAGWKSSLGSSTFENKRFFFRATPAVEYDIFPYSESTRRMLTLQYTVGAEGFRYEEETIYGKMRETHPLQTLSLNLSQTQPWGSANFGLETGQYLDATARNYASLFIGTNVRLFKGLNVNLSGNYSAIRNQIFLPRSGATDQQILTQQQQLRTNYQYFVFAGINYSFGSVLNNIVNPRFGRENGGFMMMFF